MYDGMGTEVTSPGILMRPFDYWSATAAFPVTRLLYSYSSSPSAFAGSIQTHTSRPAQRAGVGLV
jgi:hypothetical protein